MSRVVPFLVTISADGLPETLRKQRCTDLSPTLHFSETLWRSWGRFPTSVSLEKGEREDDRCLMILVC